jgi:hypothetical protein
MVKKITRSLLFSVLAMLLTTTVLAHELWSEFSPNPGVNEGVVEFFFDNYELASFIGVTVFDTGGVQIAAGVTDAMGRFDFSAYENVGHLIGRYDDEHIQIHIVAERTMYIVGMDFAGTYVPYHQLDQLLRGFVLSRWWLNIFVLVIPGGIFAASVVFFGVKVYLTKTDKKGGVGQNEQTA